MPITVSNKLPTHTTRVGWWWLLSALVHGVALLLWLHLSTSADSAQTSDTAAMIQVSLVTPEAPVATQLPTTPAETPKPKAPAVTATKLHREPVAPAQTDAPLSEQVKENTAHTVASAPVAPAAKTHPKKFSSMLHQAIDSHKHYPVVALRMRQQGTARVRFRLFEDGRIEDVTLLQTSGYQSLDHSALHAVESIAPFTPAREYLSNDEQFYVDIVFRI